MTELEKYERVNKCENIDDLVQCILDFAVDGRIQGRTRGFDAERMASLCRDYYNDETNTMFPNVITREFGLRQQAMYLKYYK